MRMLTERHEQNLDLQPLSRFGWEAQKAVLERILENMLFFEQQLLQPVEVEEVAVHRIEWGGVAFFGRSIVFTWRGNVARMIEGDVRREFVGEYYRRIHGDIRVIVFRGAHVDLADGKVLQRDGRERET